VGEANEHAGQKPKYVIIDEGTAAVSSDVEGLLYETCKAHGISMFLPPCYSISFILTSTSKHSINHNLHPPFSKKVPHIPTHPRHKYYLLHSTPTPCEP